MSLIAALPGVRRTAIAAAALLTVVLTLHPGLSASAAPDTDTTGVRDGAVLKPSRGLYITKPGTVIENLDITGCVTVAAAGVTIRNVRITCGGAVTALATKIPSGGAGLVVEDTEINGLGTTQVGVGYTNYTLRRVDIHHVADGARFGHKVLIEDSWIHDLSRIGTLHGDAVQTTSASNSVIRNNVLDSLGWDDVDLNNSALMLGSETGTRQVVNVLIEGNVLSGGNFTVNIRGDITASGLVVRGNTFVPGSRYGQVLAPPSVPIGDGNVFAGSGLPVTVNSTHDQPS